MTEPNRVRLDIPALTIFKVLVALLLTFTLIHLWPLMLLMFLGLLLAVTLDPIVTYLARYMPKSIGLSLIALLLFGATGLLIFTVGPPLVDQLVTLVNQLPAYSEQFLSGFAKQSVLRQMGERFMKNPGGADPMAYISHALTLGQLALGGLSSIALVLVFAIYMVADGRRTFRWLLAFFPTTQRQKLQQTAEEVSKVISAYVSGQVITSTACAIFVFFMLKWVGVEQALVLGVLAGLLDVLPILGFILTIIPAVVFALSISGEAAAIVGVAFVIYHAIENYLIVPAVYGNRLRVSTLTVLISLLAGALLAGILGAIAILPVVASYPIIERIWLRRFLGEVVVEKHAAIEEEAHGTPEPSPTR